MNEDNIRKWLLKNIKQYAGKKDIEINDDLKLIEELGYDSMRIVELLTKIEEKFQIKFEESENLIDAMGSVKEFVDFFVKIIKRSSYDIRY